jgi:hypothetical protein
MVHDKGGLGGSTCMYSVISKTTVLFLREVHALGIFGLSVTPRHHTKKCVIFHVQIFFTCKYFSLLVRSLWKSSRRLEKRWYDVELSRSLVNQLTWCYFEHVIQMVLLIVKQSNAAWPGKAMQHSVWQYISITHTITIYFYNNHYDHKKQKSTHKW